MIMLCIPFIIINNESTENVDTSSIFSEKKYKKLYSQVLSISNSINISSPNDIIYKEGSVGHNITWNVVDDNPKYYRNYKNDIKIKDVTWTSGYPITINVDGLSAKEYRYRLTVYDVFSNYASDTVIVTVETFIDITTTPISISETIDTTKLVTIEPVNISTETSSNDTKPKEITTSTENQEEGIGSKENLKTGIDPGKIGLEIILGVIIIVFSDIILILLFRGRRR